MYLVARAAVIKSHKLGGLNNKNVSQFKVSRGLVPSKGYREESALCLSPGFWCFAVILGIFFLAYR